jgi:hypothetical protein
VWWPFEHYGRSLQCCDWLGSWGVALDGLESKLVSEWPVDAVEEVSVVARSFLAVTFFLFFLCFLENKLNGIQLQEEK